MQSVRKRAELLLQVTPILKPEREIKPQTIVVDKKRKHESEIYVSRSVKKGRQEGEENEELFNIYSLPVEMHYFILEKLDALSILQLRQVNHYFKNLIGKCSFIWKDMIMLRHDLDDQIKLENYLKFSCSLAPFVDSVNIECSKRVNLKAFNDDSDIYFNLCNLKVNLINFNLNNVFLFELIKNCKYLNIRSLNLNSQTNHFDLKNQIKSIESQLDAQKFDKRKRNIKKFYKNLEKFELNCISYDTKLGKYFHGFNHTNFIKLFLNHKFKNLTHLSLYKYNNSCLNDLMACLSKNFEKLIYLKFQECQSQWSIEDGIEKKSSSLDDNHQLKIEHLTINECSQDLFQSVLFNLVDVYSIRHLRLLSKEENFIKNLLPSMHLKLKNLEEFQTNFDSRILTSQNFKFFENSCIRTFKMNENFSFETFNEFLNDYLIPNRCSLFNNLELFEFGVCLKCLSSDNEESMIRDLVLKLMKNFKNLEKVEILFKCIEKHCSSFKNCELLHKLNFKKNIFVTFDVSLDKHKNNPKLKIKFYNKYF